MASLLKRLSVNLERKPSDVNSSAPTGTMRNVHSFNDFSMHVGQEVDDPAAPKGVSPGIAIPVDPRHMVRRSFDVKQSSFVVGSAPTGMAPIATKALTIPRSSVANILLRESSSFTPRSSLDGPSTSFQATPRTSMSVDEPASPRSPTSPNSRRRRQQKIHGLDYYEFCELVRAGSL